MKNKKNKIIAILQAAIMLFAMTVVSGCYIGGPGWGWHHDYHHWHER
jgi:hypothetical protein